jgi:hypothetical protein
MCVTDPPPRGGRSHVEMSARNTFTAVSETRVAWIELLFSVREHVMCISAVILVLLMIGECATIVAPRRPSALGALKRVLGGAVGHSVIDELTGSGRERKDK